MPETIDRYAAVSVPRFLRLSNRPAGVQGRRKTSRQESVPIKHRRGNCAARCVSYVVSVLCQNSGGRRTGVGGNKHPDARMENHHCFENEFFDRKFFFLRNVFEGRFFENEFLERSFFRSQIFAHVMHFRRRFFRNQVFRATFS